MAKRVEKPKEPIKVYLDDVHRELLEAYIPMYGGSKGEVARSIIVDWLKTNLGWERIEEIGAIRGFGHVQKSSEAGKNETIE